MHPEIEYDANGNIVGSGLTLVPTAYQVQMNNHRLYAWCAALRAHQSAPASAFCPCSFAVPDERKGDPFDGDLTADG
jgi:hypothetical protein